MGDFLKEVPHAPQELKKRNRSVAGKDSPISVRERTSLFQRDFALGEIGYRKLRGPLPLSLHNI